MGDGEGECRVGSSENPSVIVDSGVHSLSSQLVESVDRRCCLGYLLYVMCVMT